MKKVLTLIAVLFFSSCVITPADMSKGIVIASNERMQNDIYTYSCYPVGHGQAIHYFKMTSSEYYHVGDTLYFKKEEE